MCYNPLAMYMHVYIVHTMHVHVYRYVQWHMVIPVSDGQLCAESLLLEAVRRQDTM